MTRLDVPTSSEVCAVGREAGLHAVGIATAEPFAGTRVELERRKAEGLHDGMQFTYRNPARSTDPAVTVAGARALVVGARRYAAGVAGAAGGSDRSARPMARVARYATIDHYGLLREALGVVAESLRAAGWKAVVVADDNALVDREAAYRAGLGWYGKNANLLVPGEGSWFVLGSVITDAPLAPTSAEPVADGCGACRRCLDGCPTAAIVAPGVVDARRCLAWLVQRRGSFPVEFRVALGDRLYGCDDCQEVCPPSRAGARAEVPIVEGATVDVIELLSAADDEVLARHGRWYIPDRDPDVVRRNALVVLGNSGTGGDEVETVLRRYLSHESAMLREHAAWAARRLGIDPRDLDRGSV